jgi:signal transduction histidine kinase
LSTGELRTAKVCITGLSTFSNDRSLSKLYPEISGSLRKSNPRPQHSTGLDPSLHLAFMPGDQTIDGEAVILKVSVGRRLFLLVAIQTAIAVLLVATAMNYLSRIAGDNQYMYRFQVLSLADLGHAHRYAAMLQTLTRPDAAQLGYRAPPAVIADLLQKLEDFYERYRTQWQTAEGTGSDAIRFRRTLLQLGMSDVIEREKSALERFGESIQALKEENLSSIAVTDEVRAQSPKVRHAIGDLLDINIEYAEIANQQVLRRARESQFVLLAIGLAGTALTLMMGLLVRRAIAPRIRRLVGKVCRFRDLGVIDKIVDTGDDEIAVLGNALDTGFSAIAARDRERDQFLAVAAHELKTPITSIHGFASVLATHPADQTIVDRAIDSIRRQSWRLSRLVEHLFLAARVREGEFKFEPSPFDYSALVLRSAAEIKPFFPGQVFTCDVEEAVTILGDEALLEHAIWSLFTCASALSSGERPLEVALHASVNHARLTIDVLGGNLSAHDIQALFVPFGFIEYEKRSGVRAATGLYLCHKIVQVHGGRLDVSDPGQGVRFLMVLRR